jgi:DNA-binding NarL/FixJ family response regulator
LGGLGGRQRTPHLIGREQPLRALFDALDGSDGTTGMLAVVSGEAGIGKTRLLDEFAARADHADVARGACIEGVPYAPWTDALWWLLRSDGVVTLDDLPEGVRSQLPRLLPRLGVAPAGTDDGQHVLFEAILEVLAHAAARTKLVLVIDDVHWIDPASRELLRYVTSNLRRVPMLVVVAYRPEDSTDDRELIAQLGRFGSHRIALEPLSPDATTELATFLTGDDGDKSDIERIARDADGNPLFVEELVAARDDGRIPPTLRDLMSVRFNSLDADARHLVRTAALIGPRAPRAWLAAASGLDADRARTSARAAVDAGVLLADNGGWGYAFRHALLRQAVLEDTLPDERIALHHTIAHALTDHPERAVDIDQVAELARHWDAAEEANPALRWLVAAAQQAEARYAFDAAFDAYERALFWWDAVDAPSVVAGIDHAALVLAAADAAGFAGHIERAADLGRAGLEEASIIDPERGVEAASRVYGIMWTADRAPELHEFATRTLLPVIDRVNPLARARFLVSTVEHLLTHASPEEWREAAARMLEAIRDIDDPALEARAHMVMSHCYELLGEVDLVEAEADQAVTIARDGGVHAMHALALFNHAAFYQSVPKFDACANCLDEVDELVERYGLRRYLLPARYLRALVTALEGELAGANAMIAGVDHLPAEGYDAWFRATVRSLIHLFTGDYERALAVLDPAEVGVAAPNDPDRVIDLARLQADAHIWTGDVERARQAVDIGEEAVARNRETYWHGWLAMVAMRVEADAAVLASASRRLDLIELSKTRADAILATWKAAVSSLRALLPLEQAYSAALDAEMARLTGDDVIHRARAAAAAFDKISMPYYATYFRWREAEAMLADGRVPVATELLRHARGDTRAHGFAGLDAAITQLARTHQLRLGVGRTTIDGDEPLSARELEVLHLMVDGRTNPEIAGALFITRRTAAAHVSSIMRKLGTTSRVEAVSEAHRRGVA